MFHRAGWRTLYSLALLFKCVASLDCSNSQFYQACTFNYIYRNMGTKEGVYSRKCPRALQIEVPDMLNSKQCNILQNYSGTEIGDRTTHIGRTTNYGSIYE